ncbi:hypothetical protein [Falsirhodobacter algicola]|uniref:Uncharacterized protein n=1 Tax=Falsirhodobacter algicola TaxID=2692330 RepID=A0A8J8MTC0_9RHOB|nr:hypothetical protein [Falsirhodobacter algicola]QUS36346.1 hypothetical protein GR316_08735 [Falsirhodobacter algicola]
MKPEPTWPLHPPPGEVDTLRQYVQSLARCYGVPFESFCFYALNIAHYDEEARSFIRPTEDVLERLSVGLGMSIDDLRMFEERRRRNLARLWAEFEEWIATPEGRQRYAWAFQPRSQHLGTLIGDIPM